MKLLRAEFDRRFGKRPRRVVFLSDGGKWLARFWLSSKCDPRDYQSVSEDAVGATHEERTVESVRKVLAHGDEKRLH